MQGKFASTFNQRQLWNFAQLSPQSTAYNVFVSKLIISPIDVAMLRATFEKLAERHEVFRTTLKEEDGELWQIVHPISGIRFQVVNAEGFSEDDLRRAVTERNNEIYDLTKGPLWSVQFFDRGSKDPLLIVYLHHIVWDAWSLSVFLEELDNIYSSIKQNAQHLMQPLPLQYKDLAEWQQHFIHSPNGEKQLEYWRERLKSLPEEGFSLPKRPIAERSGGSGVHFFDLSESLTFQFKKLLRFVEQRGRMQRVTMHMGLIAIFMIALHLYTAKDVVISSPKPNRLRKDLRGVRQKTDYSQNIGYFVNPVLIPTQFNQNETFLEFLDRILIAENSDRDNQDYPYHELLHRLKIKFPEINFNFLKSKPGMKNNIFSSIMSQSDQVIELKNFRLKAFFAGPLQVGLFELGVTFLESDESIHGSISYRDEIFDQAGVQRFASHFTKIMQEVVNNPNVRISEIDMMPPAEKRTVLFDFNQTQKRAQGRSDITTRASSIHGLFDMQQQAYPNRPALYFNKTFITYQELSQAAHSLAQHLRNQNLQTNDIVAILLEPSPEMIICILAVLIARAAYLPIDPKYPEGRVQHLLVDSQAKIVLTQPSLFDLLSKVKHQSQIIDATDSNLYQSTRRVNDLSDPADLAYVIYTSGSTGLPKGAMISHRNALNYLQWAIDYYEVEKGCGAPLHSSIAFDLTVTSLFTPLLSGKAVYILPDGVEGLINSLTEHPNFSLIKITPAHVRLLRQTVTPATLAQLSTVFVIGGEALYGEDIDFIRTHAPQVRIVNEYGPTETTVGCCIYEVTPETPRIGSLPIGRPIANTQLYVLDTQLRPLPLGVSGELYIGGESVGPGYLRRPQLTTERYLSDPFSSNPNSRLYKTGDHVKWLANGILIYQGRKDHQIKIRGYRIELGEIEAVINASGLVKETIVVDREDHSAQKKLVCYIVFKDASLGDEDERQQIQLLRQHIKKNLPEYMVPSYFMNMKTLPLNVNGKVDRDALPAPKLDSSQLSHAQSGPRNMQESVLAKIWSELLHLKTISIHENFFQLGGDSIIAIQMIARAKLHGLIFNLKQLNQCPTIAELSEQIKVMSSLPADIEKVTINTDDIPLTPIQHWMFEQPLVEFNHYNQAQMLEINPGVNLDRLEKALNALIGRHDALRLRFKYSGGRWKQFLLSEKQAEQENLMTGKKCHVFDLTSVPKDKQQQNVEEICSQLQAALNIETGPIIQGGIFNTAYGHRLMLTIHHLCVDAVSWRIIVEQLREMLDPKQLESSLISAPKTTTYSAWATRLASYAYSQQAHEELSYWTKQIPTSNQSLPKDKVAADGEVANSALTRNHIVSLAEDLTQQLLFQVPKTYQTKINDILLSAFVIALSSLTLKPSLYLMLEGHGRIDILDDVDLSSTVGWFTATYPVHLSLPNKDNLAQVIRAVKDQLRAVPNYGIGYGVLKYLNRSYETEILRQSAIPEISFNYVGQFDNSSDNAEKTLRYVRESTGKYISSKNPPLFPIDVHAVVVNGKLSVVWIYNPKLYEESTIHTVAQGYIKALENIITHCLNPQKIGGQLLSSLLKDFHEDTESKLISSKGIKSKL